MQVPERLALIGGSILLSSTLIFTLKSQASSIIPHVGHSIGNVYQDITNTNAEHGVISFGDAFKKAQKDGDTTGQWGTSKYYIDKDQNMHIGKGQLDKPLYDILGNDEAHQVKTINLDEDIQAPSNSNVLFAGKNYNSTPDSDTNFSITTIHGLNRLDVSHVTTMNDMFYRDLNLSNDLAVEDWNTSNVSNMEGMFGNTSITNLDLHKWDTSKNQRFGWMFFNDRELKDVNVNDWNTSASNSMNRTFAGTVSLNNLDLSSWNTASSDLSSIFGDYNGAAYGGITSSLNHLTIGSQAKFNNTVTIPHGNWKQGQQSLNDQQLIDGNVHPGSWTKQ